MGAREDPVTSPQAAGATLTGSASSDAGMLSGPAIACFIFFEVAKLATTATGLRAALRALPRHDVWLESTGDLLERLPGVLELVSVSDRDDQTKPQIRRERDRFVVRLPLAADAFQRAAASETSTLMLAFDVTYREGYESPGGYSPAYGIHYWDDVTHPVVEVDRFEFS